MPTNAKLLSDSALALKNSNPRAFDDFVDNFVAYTGEVTTAVIEADPTNILALQGRAQQCRAILKLLRECHIVRKPPAPTAP